MVGPKADHFLFRSFDILEGVPLPRIKWECRLRRF